MKIYKVMVFSLGAILLSNSAFAQFGASSSGLQKEVDALREDVSVLQRQLYRDQSKSGLTPSSSSNVMVRMGEFDELLRKAIGKMDELEFKVKALDEKINLVNKDMDMRIKMIEGKPIQGGGMGAAIPSKKFSAPVASAAPKSVTGDSIKKGDDLPPVKGGDVNEIYQAGLEALKNNENAQAEQNFNAVLKKFPNDKLAGNAQYWLGEVYYGQKAFDKAAIAFAKGYEGYRSGPKGADSLLKLGMSMRELGKKEEACAAFLSMPKEFPKANGVLLEKAKAEALKNGCK